MSKISTYIDSFFRSRIVSHVAFWSLMLLILAYHGSLFGGNFRDNLINMACIMPMQMMAAYLMVYVQIPRWLYKRHWILFVLSSVVFAYFLSAMARLSVVYIAEPLINFESYDESLWEVLSDPMYLIKVYMVSVYLPTFLFFLIKMTKERFVQENRLIKLEKEKGVAELNFLKAQMNPHFLFNTLNNIYSLSQNNSENTSEMILKLSEILDYTIYECQAARVPMSKEWQLIENYVDLQAVRHTEQLMIVIDQDIDNEEEEIAPLILISLVENAFKHSLSQSQDVANIKIMLKVEQKALTFEVFNTISENSRAISPHKKGIGVQNVKRQLALQYPDRHSIQITAQPDSYKVILSIDL